MTVFLPTAAAARKLEEKMSLSPLPAQEDQQLSGHSQR